jgi:toxin FitB
VTFLLDTNVVSESRKRRPDRHVMSWLRSLSDDDVFLSVIVIGEIRQGIERLRRRDESQARALDPWMEAMQAAFATRIRPITVEIAQEWGVMNSGDPMPANDSLIAATAKVHDLTVVTRNTVDYRNIGIQTLNPFEPR